MRLAQPAEIALVMDLVTEVCAWLADRGIQQWSSPPGPEVSRLLAREIAAGEVYLAQLSGAGAVGMLRFEWRDTELWPHDPAGGGYVHSFLVRPGYHGQAIGAGMLSWAADHVRARARRYLRLDCVADNERLRRYYERIGFRCQGVASYAGYTGALFELDLEQQSDGGEPPHEPR